MRTVLILMDTLNRRFLKSYDENAEGITPCMDAFAKEAVRFDNHFIASAPCMPARRDIFTGRMNFLERGWGGMEPFDRTLQGELRNHGVYTHITTDHAHYFELGGENYCSLFDTWDYHRGQENDPWISRVNPPFGEPQAYGRKSVQHLLNRQEYARGEETYPTPATFLSACRWAEENRGANDFFLMVEAFDPHEPFDAPDAYHELDAKYNVSSDDTQDYSTDEIIQKVLSYLSQNYREGSLSSLAESLYLNPSYLSQLIKQKTSKTFSDLLGEARMKQAALFLKDPDTKIYNISNMIGYVNPNNFARAFKAYWGVTPTEYRSHEK